MNQTPIDPIYQPLLELMPPNVELSDEMLPHIRAHMAALTPPLDANDNSVKMQELLIDSHCGPHQIRVLIYRHGNAEDDCPALLEIHGGGHILGSADMGDSSNRALARMIEGVVVSVDYRLAPETPYPGPIEDCYSALLWLYSQSKQLHIDPQRLGVIGTSAGGGLAASLCLMARDKGVVPLAFQGLLMPMLDNLSVARHEASPPAHVGQHVWTAQNNRYCWRAMLGHIPNDEKVPCYAAAARASDLSGLPPTYIGIGSLDLFAEETLTYTQRLIEAGVPVDCHVFASAPHGYNAIAEASATHSEQHLLQHMLNRAFQKPA